MEIKIMSYNTHLFGNTAPGFFGQEYYDEQRKDAICNFLKSSEYANLDVVCLCEVWDDLLKTDIIHQLQETFPYSFYNDSSIMSTGNGLLILSKLSLFNQSYIVFDDLTGWDALSQKGVDEVCVFVAPFTTFRILLSHTQAGDDHSTERYSNLTEISNEAKEYSQVGTRIENETYIPVEFTPAVILGDLNVEGDSDEYNSMMSLFAPLTFVDSYKQSNPSDDGYTDDPETNSTANHFNNGGSPKRLDYIMLTENDWLINSVQVITDWKVTVDESQIDCSDHYPLMASVSLNKDVSIEIDNCFVAYGDAYDYVQQCKDAYGDGVSDLIIVHNNTSKEIVMYPFYNWDNGGVYSSFPPPVIAPGMYAGIFHHHPNGEAYGCSSYFAYKFSEDDLYVFCAFDTPWSQGKGNKVKVGVSKNKNAWNDHDAIHQQLRDSSMSEQYTANNITLSGTTEKGTSPLVVYVLDEQQSD